MTIKELKIFQKMIAGLLSLAYDNKEDAAGDLQRALVEINYLIQEKYEEEEKKEKNND